MAVDVEGRPICYEMWPGNTADVITLVPIVRRTREGFRLDKAWHTMCYKEWASIWRGFAWRWKSMSGRIPEAKMIGNIPYRQRVKKVLVLAGKEARALNHSYVAPLKIKEVWVENCRHVVCLNEEERREDAHDREAIVAHLKEQLRPAGEPRHRFLYSVEAVARTRSRWI
jgi:hypothetical protein